MINYLFEKKSKWIPLVAYNTGGTDYIVFVRMGKRSGMIYFKTKRITPFMSDVSYNFSKELFDIKKQFEQILGNTDTN